MVIFLIVLGVVVCFSIIWFTLNFEKLVDSYHSRKLKKLEGKILEKKPDEKKEKWEEQDVDKILLIEVGKRRCRFQRIGHTGVGVTLNKFIYHNYILSFDQKFNDRINEIINK